MKLLRLTKVLALVALSSLSADVALALPSPSSHLSLRIDHGESSPKTPTSGIFDKASLENHLHTMISRCMTVNKLY